MTYIDLAFALYVFCESAALCPCSSEIQADRTVFHLNMGAFPIVISGREMRDEQIMADLTQYRADYDNHRFEIIRLDGYTSVFIDRRLVAGFANGFSGKFYFFWGAGLFPGGKYAGGQFDNVLIRVK